MDGVVFSAAAAIANITPPLKVGLLTSSVNGLYEPFEYLRTPLKARVLVLKSNKKMVAVVSLDLLALNDTAVGGWDHFKNGLCGELPANQVILNCTHTHNAPESVALSDLYLTAVYKSWLIDVQQKIKGAIGKAIANLAPCRVSVGVDTLNGYTMQRRIPTPEGIVMSDSIQPIAPQLMEKEPVDRRVHTIRFQGEQDQVIATVVHAVCHPVHEMCLPHISAEFPGEMCAALEESGKNGIPFFLNGAAGDINPPTVSCGPKYSRKHGRAIAEVAVKEDLIMVDGQNFSFINSNVQLSIRPGSNMTNSNDAIARFNAIRIGSLAIIFLPGEPFTETALKIEENSPFQQTIVVAYGENNIGYIPTIEASQQGGYEAGPGKWSFLEPGTDHLLIEEAGALLKKLYNE